MTIFKTSEEFSSYMDIYRQMERSLSISVQISHEEAFKLTVNDLISKRNANPNKIVDSFDQVLMYYLGKDDFEKYVINGEKL